MTYSLPLAVIPPVTDLYNLSGQLNHQSIFIKYEKSDQKQIQSPTHEAIPITGLPSTISPSRAHRFKSKILAQETWSPLIYSQPKNHQEFQQSIRNPDIDFLLLDLSAISSLITHEAIKTAKEFQKVLLVDLTSLLETYGYQRSHLIHKVLLRSQYLKQKLPILPVTFPSPAQPQLLRPASSIVSILQLLQIPPANIIKQSRSITILLKKLKVEKSLNINTLLPKTDPSNEISKFPFPLPPLWKSQPRIPQRYLSVKFIYPTSRPQFDERSMQRYLNHNFHYLFGEITGAHTHLRLIDYNQKSQHLIIRTTPRTIPHIRVMLALLTHLDKIPVIPSIQSISGTLKSLQTK